MFDSITNKNKLLVESLGIIDGLFLLFLAIFYSCRFHYTGKKGLIRPVQFLGSITLFLIVEF